MKKFEIFTIFRQNTAKMWGNVANYITNTNPGWGTRIFLELVLHVVLLRFSLFFLLFWAKNLDF